MGYTLLLTISFKFSVFIYETDLYGSSSSSDKGHNKTLGISVFLVTNGSSAKQLHLLASLVHTYSTPNAQGEYFEIFAN